MEYDLPTDPGAFPNRVTLELTNRCNLNCTFCPRRYMEKERGMMDSGLARRLLLEISDHSPVAVVPFFRGESLLHPDWDGIMRYAKELNVGDVQFTTNASLLTPENAEKLLALELSFVSFSLDTIDPQLYNANRRGADYDLVVSNVLHFLKRKEELGVGTQIQVSSVETEAHKARMDEFVAFWQPRVDRVRVYTEHSSDGNPGSIAEPMPAFPRRLPCRKLYSDMVVYWNGDVAICNHDWTRIVNGAFLGNVGRSSIAEVWRSPAYEALRQAHHSDSLSGVAPCEGCDHWKMYYMAEGALGRTYLGHDHDK